MRRASSIIETTRGDARKRGRAFEVIGTPSSARPFRPSPKVEFVCGVGASEMLTLERLKTLLYYDPATGIFRHLVYRCWRGRAGNVAGRLTVRGYIEICIDGKRYKAHRLAWFYVYGDWPKIVIDHINRNRCDNRIENLRDVTHAENICNSVRRDMRAVAACRQLHGEERAAASFAVALKVGANPRNLMARKESALNADGLRSYLHYDSATGVFCRRPGGAHLGSKHPQGYIHITINSRPYRAHRLAWLYVYGRWPAGDIDHINCDRSDNRIVNLREATRVQNNANRKPATDHPKGVTQRRGRTRWQAQIGYRGRNIYLGYFGTVEEAHAAYAAKAIELYGEFGRVR